MQLSNVMTRNVETVRSDATLQDAAKMMNRLDVGVLPIFDDGQLTGIITDRDIATRAVAEGRDPKTTQVRDTMTPEAICCFEDQALDDVAQMMQEKQVRRVPVLNRDEQLVGMVSLADLAVDVGDEELAGETLKRISQPAQPAR